MEEKFNDLGVDAIVGGDLMYKVGITEWDLREPQKFEKMKEKIMESASMMGLPENTDMNVIFNNMSKLIDMMRTQIDKEIRG
jgi:hypothetical protein